MGYQRKIALFATLSLCCILGSAAGGVQAFFSATDRLDQKLIAQIDREKRSIRIAVYCFSHQQIADALIRAKRRSVAVQVVVDASCTKMHSMCHRLQQEGIALFVWSPPTHGSQSQGKYKALMHNKFCIFGQRAVWTGSFNFTRAASELHRENAVLIDEKEVVRGFERQFEALASECTLVPPPSSEAE